MDRVFRLSHQARSQRLHDQQERAGDTPRGVRIVAARQLVQDPMQWPAMFCRSLRDHQVQSH